jgi:hypothetical protein
VSLIPARDWVSIVLPSGHVRWQYFTQYVPCIWVWYGGIFACCIVQMNVFIGLSYRLTVISNLEQAV